MDEPQEQHQVSPLAEWIDSRSGFLFASVLIICAAIVMVSCLRNPVDFDSWWHLKMGQDLVELGLSPFLDHYSFTYLGERISQPPVIFQLAYYFLNQWFGEWGGQVAYKLIAFSALFLCFLLRFKQVSAPLWVRVLILAILVTAIQSRMQIRPELISYSLMVISFLLYCRARRALNWRNMLPIALLLLFWVNYHNPLFGYIIFFGLFIDVAVQHLQRRASLKLWAAWAGWGALLLLLGFLRPDGEHFLVAWYSFSPEWRESIREYFVPVHYLTHPPAYLWMAIAAAATVLSLFQRRWGYLIILAVFVSSAFSMARMIVPALIVVLCILLDCLSDASLRKSDAGTQTLAYRLITTSSTLATLTSIVFGFTIALTFLSENRTNLPNVPESTVDYLEEINAQGAIFNMYRVGGYILYRLGPELKVYIDGRTDILYPIEHFRRYTEARDTEGVFQEEVARYDIRFALLPNNEAAGRMMHNAGFVLDYSGPRLSLYRRDQGRFPTLGALSTFPYCNEIADLDALRNEVMTGFEENSDTAFINSLMALAYNYNFSTEKTGFLNGLDFGQLTNRPSKRLFAALALENGLDERGVNALDRLDFQIPRDMLAAVFMDLRRGATDAAANRLRFALQRFRDWEYVFERDLELLVLALTELDPDGSRNLLAPEARQELEANVPATPGAGRFSQVRAEVFCDDSPWPGGE